MLVLNTSRTPDHTYFTLPRSRRSRLGMAPLSYLRAVVGPEPSDEQLSGLLKQHGYNVASAANELFALTSGLGRESTSDRACSSEVSVALSPVIGNLSSADLGTRTYHFQEGPIGLGLMDSVDGIVVSDVEHGSQAEQLRVPLLSVIISVDGQLVSQGRERMQDVTRMFAERGNRAIAVKVRHPPTVAQLPPPMMQPQPQPQPQPQLLPQPTVAQRQPAATQQQRQQGQQQPLRQPFSTVSSHPWMPRRRWSGGVPNVVEATAATLSDAAEPQLPSAAPTDPMCTNTLQLDPSRLPVQWQRIFADAGVGPQALRDPNSVREIVEVLAATMTDEQLRSLPAITGVTDHIRGLRGEGRSARLAAEVEPSSRSHSHDNGGGDYHCSSQGDLAGAAQKLRDLQALGFDVDAASVALEEAGGNSELALELLLALGADELIASAGSACGQASVATVASIATASTTTLPSTDQPSIDLSNEPGSKAVPTSATTTSTPVLVPARSVDVSAPIAVASPVATSNRCTATASTFAGVDHEAWQQQRRRRHNELAEQHEHTESHRTDSAAAEARAQQEESMALETRAAEQSLAQKSAELRRALEAQRCEASALKETAASAATDRAAALLLHKQALDAQSSTEARAVAMERSLAEIQAQLQQASSESVRRATAAEAALAVSTDQLAVMRAQLDERERAAEAERRRVGELERKLRHIETRSWREVTEKPATAEEEEEPDWLRAAAEDVSLDVGLPQALPSSRTLPPGAPPPPPQVSQGAPPPSRPPPPPPAPPPPQFSPATTSFTAHPNAVPSKPTSAATLAVASAAGEQPLVSDLLAELRAHGSGRLRPASPRREQHPLPPTPAGHDPLVASLAGELAKALERRRGAVEPSDSLPTSPRGEADWN